MKRIKLHRGTVIAAAMMLAALPSWASDHVLVMTVSNYSMQPLPGVKYDAANALALADKLGYDTSGAMVFKDRQLTKAGLRDAMAQLALRVKLNDRVFIYYSGHGASLKEGGQCVQSLVGQDGGLVSLGELNAHLDNIKTKTQDVLVMVDACHSGGLGDMVVTRSIDGKGEPVLSQGGLSAKVFMTKDGETCDGPVNVAKSWTAQPPVGSTRSIAFPQNNFTFIAAANEREVALDDNERGGLATTSLLACLENGVADIDGSGVVSAKELVACAQKNIAAEVPRLNARKGTRWAAHTVEGYGNVARALNTVKVAQETAQTAAQSSTVNQAATVNQDWATRTIAAFTQIAAGSNGNWAFAVQPTATVVPLSKPEQQRAVYFPYTSSQPGYGYVLYVGTDGKDMKQLFPGRGENNFMSANSQFPGLRIDGPPGKNTYLFVISQLPRDFNNVFAGEGAAVNSATLASVQCELGKRNEGRADTQGPCAQNRNAIRVDAFAAAGSIEGYAAQMLVVEGR